MDASSSSAPASSAAVRRLRRDLEVLRKSGNPQILVRPAEENLLEWHFLLHSLPDDTPYSEGCYHGKVIFPSEYPHAPPAILMMTPSGRLETRKRLCLSMTDFHPESWNPAWSVETILVGLLSFFISEERGYGSMNASREERVRLARQSRRSNAEDELFRQLFPEYVERTEADSPETCGGSVTADAERPETAAERAEDAEDLEAANSRRPSVSEGSEGVAECWICRDVTGEPLIQPCRCRGSMSGVHASCVEEWIRRHRRSARDDAPPRCSVCHQPYQGSERVPGVRDFVSHNCRAGAAQCGRVLVLFGLLMLYQECAMDGNLLTPLRALGVTFVALVTIYRLWVLFVSLPQHRAPPQHWLLQRLFVPGQQELAKHLAEAMSFVTVLTVWVIAGLISWPFAVPYAVAAAALAAKLGLGRQAGWRCLPTRDCLVRSLRAALCILVSPLILIWATGEFLWRYPRALHPLGPAPHLAFAIAVIPMAWTLQSNLPLLILWVTHVTFIVGGLVELFCLKRWQWKRGLAWVIVLQVTLIGCYISNICVFPQGVGNSTQSAILVLGTSCSWLLLVLMLALKINWELCRQYYRTWQRRHGSFTLDAATPEPA